MKTINCSITSLFSLFVLITFFACRVENDLFPEGNELSDSTIQIDDRSQSPPIIAILPYSCGREAENLIVYNPENPDMDFYNNDQYAILWFNKNKLIHRGFYSGCLCGTAYKVKVVNLKTEKYSEISYYRKACIARNSEQEQNF